MALPTKSKTWQLNINNVALSAGEVVWHQQLLFDLKEAMIGFGTLPWTVVSSSDSVTADNTDRWVAPSNIVWSTGNHSWIVLQNADGMQICFDAPHAVSSIEDMQRYCSPSVGFTAGTIGARPTASDEYNTNTGIDANYWFANQIGTPANNVWHMWHSTDGKVTYMVGMKANKCHTFWALGEIQDARAGHTSPFMGTTYTYNSSAVEVLTVPLIFDFTRLRTEHGGTVIDVYATGVGHNNSNSIETAQGAVAEEIDNELFLSEVGLMGSTIGGRGPKGRLHDIYWGQYQIASTGDTYPNNASLRDWVQIGHLVFPWTGDATVPQTS